MRSHALLVALAAVVAPGCFRGPVSPTLAHLDEVPQAASFLIAVDVDQIRASRWWGPLVEPLVSTFWINARHRRELVDKCHLDPVRDVHWVVIALDATGQAARGAAIVNGSWDRAQLDRCSRALGGDPQTRPDGLTRYGGDAYVGWVAPDTLAVSLGEDARPFVREMVEHGPSVRANPAVARELARVDPGAALWIAGTLGQRKSPLHALELDENLPAVGMVAQLVVGEGLTGSVRVEMTSPADAARVARAWSGILAKGQREVPELAGVTASSAGANVELAIAVDAGALAALGRFAHTRAPAEPVTDQPPP